MQQINLHQPASTRLGRWWWLLGAWLLPALLLAGWGGWQQQQLGSERTQLRQLKAHVTQSRLQLAPTAQSSSVVPQAANQTLPLAATFQSNSFAQLLDAFARQAVPQLWLTHIRLAAGGKQMVLHGQTTDAVSVPMFVKQLGADQALVGRQFAHLGMREVAELKVHGVLAFELYSGAAPSELKGALHGQASSLSMRRQRQ